MLPAEHSPSQIFKSLFVAGDADGDRHGQYFTPVREFEKRLLISEERERKPKPKTDAASPKSGEYLFEKSGAMYGPERLAFATDRTRSITLMIQHQGIETDNLASTTGTMKALNPA